MDKREVRDHVRRAQGIALRKLRESREISQDGLAKLAGLDRVYVSQLERGEHTASLEIIERILLALGLEYYEFGMQMTFALREIRQEKPKRKKENGPVES